MSKHILVVDDDPSILSVFELILSGQDYQVSLASSGEGALEHFKSKGTPDLVIMDFKMPGISGFEAYKRIKAQNPTVPVFIMTGYTVDSIVKDAMKLGLRGVIFKPFDMEEILQLIKKTIWLHPSPHLN